MSGQLPARIGYARQNPLALAESAIRIAEGINVGRKMRISVGIDVAGEVFVDRTADVHESELIATFLRSADPDWLAEEIEFALRERA